jgi:hypothetical protein
MWLRAFPMMMIHRAPEDGGAGAGGSGAAAGASGASAGSSILPGERAAAGGGAAPGAASGPDWLPAELRSDPALKDFKDVGALAASFKSAQALVGADKAAVLRIPKDEADEAGFAEVFAKLGRPEKPDGYKLTAPEGTAPETITAFATVAHKAGLSGRQAGAVMDFYREAVTAQAAALEQQAVTQTTEAQTALRTEWGNAFADKVHGIQKLLMAAGGQPALDAFNAIGGGRNTVLLKALARIADSQAEPNALRGGSGGGMGAALTPAAAQAKIAEKQRDPEFMKAYNTRDHAAHAAAVKEMSALFAEAYPQDGKAA